MQAGAANNSLPSRRTPPLRHSACSCVCAPLGLRQQMPGWRAMEGRVSGSVRPARAKVRLNRGLHTYTPIHRAPGAESTGGRVYKPGLQARANRGQQHVHSVTVEQPTHGTHEPASSPTQSLQHELSLLRARLPLGPQATAGVAAARGGSLSRPGRARGPSLAFLCPSWQHLPPPRLRLRLLRHTQQQRGPGHSGRELGAACLLGRTNPSCALDRSLVVGSLCARSALCGRTQDGRAHPGARPAANRQACPAGRDGLGQVQPGPALRQGPVL